MEIIAELPAFIVAALVIALAPGPAMALLIRRSARDGFLAGLVTLVGVEVGLYILVLLTGAGVAALLAASEAAYLVLRVAGTAVLLWLGFKAWRAALGQVEAPDLDSPLSGPALGRCFFEGLVTNLANPKALILILAFYPQFVPAGYSPFTTSAILGLVQVAVDFVIYLALVAGVARARVWFARPTVLRTLDGLAGTVFIGLGLRLALSSR